MQEKKFSTGSWLKQRGANFVKFDAKSENTQFFKQGGFETTECCPVK
jgi:hypothetical protein